MRKTLLSLMLLLALAFPALGETSVETLYYDNFSAYRYAAEEKGVVANFRAADRLNLRKEPDARADTLGRFYSGTPLTVLSDNGQGWLQVRIGDLTGYMQKQYIMPKNRNYGAPQLFFTASIDHSATLCSAPKSNAQSRGTLKGEVYVLADVGDDWRYVLQDDVYGYLRTSQLRGLKAQIPLAFARAADGGNRVTVYRDADLKKSTAALYGGAPLRVTAVSRAGGWAAVDCCGLVWTDDYAGPALSGYIRLEDLLVFTQPWQAPRQYAAARTLKSCALSNGGRVEANTLLSVVGEQNGQYLVKYQDETGFVPKTSLYLTGGLASRKGPDAIGYAQIRIPRDSDGWGIYPRGFQAPGGTEEGEVWGPTAEILACQDGWYQLRTPSWNSFFLPEKDVAAVVNQNALYPETAVSHTAGEWTVSAAEAGLHQFHMPAGETGTLTLQKPGETEAITYTLGGDQEISYTLFLWEGTQMQLTGGGQVRGAAEGMLPVVLQESDAPPPRESEALFSGSGRFYLEEQLVNDSNWFDFWIKPLPGAEDSYYVRSTIFSEGEPVYLDENMTEQSVGNGPGNILEVHNCQIFINFGNG